MQSKLVIRFLTVLLFFFSFGLIAQDHSNKEPLVSHEKHEGTPEQISLKAKIKESINHHLLDSHDFIFFSDSETGKHYGFSLPVILWDNEAGLQLFSSSKFHYGEEVAENNGNYYTLYHNKVYKLETAEETITLDDHHHPTQAKPLDFSITKSVLMILVTGILMLLAFVGMAKSFKKGPIVTGAGRFLEPIILYIRDEIAIPNIGEKKHGKYMPYLLTVFFFVWFLNLFGLTPLGVNVTGNIAITFALAILTFIITQVSGNKNYWMHIFDPLGNSMPWYGKVPLYFILIPIEILGVFVKPFALMIRLYANIMAGHIVLMSLIGLIFIFQNWIGSSASFVLSFAISMIELLVALLQAYIFTMLSALYFGFAVVEHEEAH